MSLSILVVAGGLTAEREVSLASGAHVAELLRAAGHDVTVCDYDAALLSTMAQTSPDLVFPAVHGGVGEDGTIAELAHLSGLAHIGSCPGPARSAFDKATARTILARAGVPMSPAIALAQSVFRDVGARDLSAAIIARLGLPLVVKPVRGGSALGVSGVIDEADLPGALVAAYGYGNEVLIERAVAGREVAITVVDTATGPRALTAVEIEPVHDMFDYETRYTPGGATYHVPARLTHAELENVGKLAVAAHTALGLRHLSRTDLIVERDGPIVLEVNGAPGLTRTSLAPMALTADALSLAGLVEEWALTTAGCAL
jgi:D-alanine-D-alanine ligase